MENSCWHENSLYNKDENINPNENTFSSKRFRGNIFLPKQFNIYKEKQMNSSFVC